MATAFIEHVNFTVRNPMETAEMLCRIFGWKIRWSGDAIHGGHTVHVGSDTHYLALYSPSKVSSPEENNYNTEGGLNHIGVVVDSLESTEERIHQEDIETFNHADYEPGRRFYFILDKITEFEVVSYT